MTSLLVINTTRLYRTVGIVSESGEKDEVHIQAQSRARLPEGFKIDRNFDCEGLTEFDPVAAEQERQTKIIQANRSGVDTFIKVGKD